MRDNCPPGWTLHHRTARGFEHAVAELVPANTPAGELTDLPGRLSPAAVLVFIQTTVTERTPTATLARDVAMGRHPQVTTTTLVWQAWQVRTGRLAGQLPGRWDTLEAAVRACLRAPPPERPQLSACLCS